MPTSGGTDWNDPDARSGVGDGDNEVAASEHPESVGFTESEVYLETDRPSLYDAFNETYGEPFKPKKTGEDDRAGAAGRRRAEGAAQREPPGRPRVLRRPAEAGAAPAAPGRAGRQGPGLRQGPDPAAPRPDGATATSTARPGARSPAATSTCPPSWRPSGAWLRLAWPPAPFLAGTVAHQVKIGTLDSSPMPMPPTWSGSASAASTGSTSSAGRSSGSSG